jgi:hypothetical protein
MAKAWPGHFPSLCERSKVKLSRADIKSEQSAASATTLSTLRVSANETSNKGPVAEHGTPFDSGASKARQVHAMFQLIRCAKSGICCAMVKTGCRREMVDTSVDRCRRLLTERPTKLLQA